MLGPLMRWGFMMFVIVFVAALMPTLTERPPAPQVLSPAERRKRTVLRALRLINGHDWDALWAMLGPAFVLHHPVAGDLDREGYIRFLQDLQQSVPCLCFEHDCLVTNDEWVMVHCTLVGETKTRVGGVSVFRVEDDEMITAAYVMLDAAEMLQDARAA
jgi:hypothetical protein